MKTNSSTGNTKPTSIEERALVLLSSGIPAVRVAESLGVDPSRISQLVSDSEFSAKLTEKRFENLTKNNEIDAKIQSAEDKLLDKLLDSVDSVYKPMEIMKIFQVVNAAKRRGLTSASQVHEQKEVIPLVMPTRVINNFTVNMQNQVINAGGKDLITIQSSALADKFKQESDNELRQRVRELTVREEE